MTALDKLKQISTFLASLAIEDAVREAEILIIEILHIDRSRLYSDTIEIPDDIAKQIDSLIVRRVQGEPIQYIIGHVEFLGLVINVGKGVLIPRPETELLVEEAIKELKRRFTVHGSRFTVLDLCTGSGCIAIALAKHFPDAHVYGVDKSDTAIQYATRNAIENNVKNVHFIKGDLFEPVKNKKFDCIVSNPPYIKTGDIQTLQREIKEYEPVEALDGGEDGLKFYRRILSNADRFLKKNGIIILEIGHDQADSVLSIARGVGFKTINFIRDYADIKRICVVSQNIEEVDL